MNKYYQLLCERLQLPKTSRHKVEVCFYSEIIYDRRAAKPVRSAIFNKLNKRKNITMVE